MLNTATWTNSHGTGTAMQALTLMPDFDYQEEFDTVPATALTKPPSFEKPYIYGRHLTAADRLRAEWNRTHPSNPMP